MFDQWDDDKLDEIEEADPRIRKALAEQHVYELQKKPSVLPEEIRITEKTTPGLLDMVRDMFLSGNDVQAISVLCSELGLVPKAKHDEVAERVLALEQVATTALAYAYARNTGASSDPKTLRAELNLRKVALTFRQTCLAKAWGEYIKRAIEIRDRP